MDEIKVLGKILENAILNAEENNIIKIAQSMENMRSLKLPPFLEVALSEFVYRHMNDCIKERKIKTVSVYFLRSRETGLIKIGKTQNSVENRVNQIRGMCAGDLDLMTFVVDHTGKLERKLHKDFEEYNINGEWFSPAEKIINYIDRINENK